MTFITQQDLKKRADSLVFSKYKQIKKEAAKKEAQKRLNWFMSIVKCKAWVNKCKKAVANRKAREAKEEEERR